MDEPNYYLIVLTYVSVRTGKQIREYRAHYGRDKSAINRCERIKNRYAADAERKNLNIQLFLITDYIPRANFY